MRTSSSMLRAAVAAVVACAAAPLQASAAAVALACAEYDQATTPVDINVTESGITKPSVVAVDTGEWVYYADNTNNKIVRFTGDSVKPTFEELAAGSFFGSISGICLSPKDQAMYVADALNNTLFIVPCIATAQPSNPKTGPYCSKYADYSGQFEVPLDRPARCAVDKNNNIFITQNSDQLVIINQTNFSYTTRTVAGATALGPVVVDLFDLDVYVGDITKDTIYRLPCTRKDADGIQCMELSTDAVSPKTAPVTISSSAGLALNRGDGTGDFELLVADSTSSKIVAINHPKSATQSSGTLLVQLPANDAPADIALDPLRFDVVIAEPMYALETPGRLSRLVCNDEVFAPSPAAAPGSHTTTAAATTTTPAPSPTNGNMSAGSVFLLILFLIALVYFGGGAIFFKVTQQRWAIPNEQMWRNFGALVVDGAGFAFCCRKPTVPSPYNNTAKAKASTDSDFASPQYENYDAMHDDL